VEGSERRIKTERMNSVAHCATAEDQSDPVTYIQTYSAAAVAVASCTVVNTRFVA